MDAARRLVAEHPENRYLLGDRLVRLVRWQAENGHRSHAAACLHECERLWTGDANGLRGVARSFHDLAEKVKSSGRPSSAEQQERQDYLAEAARLEKAADGLRSRK